MASLRSCLASQTAACCQRAHLAVSTTLQFATMSNRVPVCSGVTRERGKKTHIYAGTDAQLVIVSTSIDILLYHHKHAYNMDKYCGFYNISRGFVINPEFWLASCHYRINCKVYRGRTRTRQPARDRGLHPSSSLRKRILVSMRPNTVLKTLHMPCPK